MLLIAQIMMILRNESKEEISAGYIIVRAAGCLGNYAATILGLGLFAALFPRCRALTITYYTGQHEYDEIFHD